MTDKEKTRAFNKARAEALKRRTAIQSDTRAEIVRLLKVAQEQIAAILASQPSDYQLWALPRLQAEINRVLAEFGAAGGSAIGTAAGTAWQAGQDLVDLPLEAGGVRVAGVLPHMDTGQLMAMRAFMTDRIKDIGVQAANKINSELGLVAIGAQGPSEAIGQVSKILGEPSRTRATAIIRTEISGVFDIASHERKLQAVQYVPGLKKQWRRSGKIHSRLHHDAADGQIQEVTKPFILHGPRGPVKIMHPHDPKADASEKINCGCVSIPYMEHWDMVTPGRKDYTADELARSPQKRMLNDGLKGPTVNELLAAKPTR